jgi:hypothetical protein
MTNNHETPAVVPPAEEPDDFKAMATGAALIFVVSFIPYASFSCCLPYLFAGLLAVHLYTSKYALTLSLGSGIKLGIFTCLMGGFAAWVVAMAIRLIFDYQVGAKEGEALGLYMAEKMGGPEAAKAAREAIAAQQSQGITVAQVLIGIASVAVFSALSGLIAGALGAAIFKRGPQRGSPPA